MFSPEFSITGQKDRILVQVSADPMELIYTRGCFRILQIEFVENLTRPTFQALSIPYDTMRGMPPHDFNAESCLTRKKEGERSMNIQTL